MVSLVARIADKSRWSWVPLATAVAAARWVEASYPPLKGRVRIKWPNDLWIVPHDAPAGAPGAKLGGILCEAVGSRAGSFIVIGLGLNCLSAPDGLDQQTSSLSRATGSEVRADDVRAGVIEAVLSALDGLSAHGPERLVRDYERLAAFPPGARISWAAGSGIVLGLGPSGELRVELAHGVEQNLFAEDVSVRPDRTTASDGSPA